MNMPNTSAVLNKTDTKPSIEIVPVANKDKPITDTTPHTKTIDTAKYFEKLNTPPVEMCISENRLKVRFPFNIEILSVIRKMEKRFWNPLSRTWCMPISQIEKLKAELDKINVKYKMVNKVKEVLIQRNKERCLIRLTENNKDYFKDIIEIEKRVRCKKGVTTILLETALLQDYHNAFKSHGYNSYVYEHRDNKENKDPNIVLNE